MGAIQLRGERLLTDRVRDVQAMLAPLGGERPIACELATAYQRGARELVAHDGASALDDPPFCRIRPKHSRLEFTYRERWIPSTGIQTVWSLGQAHLTAFLKDSVTHDANQQLLCVHCEPDGDTLYKRGPHLHISMSPHPLPNCHFHLFLSTPTEVLDSVGSLSDALHKVAEMIRDEVVPRYSC